MEKQRKRISEWNLISHSGLRLSILLSIAVTATFAQGMVCDKTIASEWEKKTIDDISRQLLTDSTEIKQFQWQSLYDNAIKFVERKAQIFRSNIFGSMCEELRLDTQNEFFIVEHYWHKRAYGQTLYLLAEGKRDKYYLITFDDHGQVVPEEKKSKFDYNEFLGKFDTVHTSFTNEDRKVGDLLIVTRFVTFIPEVKVILLPTRIQIDSFTHKSE